MSKKYVFVDLETSGLFPENGHVILSIGAIAQTKVRESPFYQVICPTQAEFDLAAPKALEVNGFTWDQLIEEGLPFQQALNAFLEWGSKNYVKKGRAQIIGHNIQFDLKFLKYYMGTALDFLGFPWDDVIDIKDMWSSMVNRGKLDRIKDKKGRSAANIAKALGVEGEPDIHNALEGAKLAQRNFHALVEAGFYDED